MPPSALVDFCQSGAHLEGGVVGHERAGKHGRSLRPLALDDHAARRAHHVARALLENRPAARGDLRHVVLTVHLGQQHERTRIGRINRPGALGEETRIALARFGFALMPAGAARDRHPEAVLGKPVEPGNGARPSARSALGLVQRLAVVVEADADREAPAEARVEVEQPALHLGSLHRLHGVAEHQHLEAALQGIPHQLDQVRVHEGLTAREADLAGAKPSGLDLVEVGRGLGRRYVGEPAVARARFDIAVLTGNVAERAGVDPERLEPLERHAGPGLAGRRPVGILEFSRRMLRLQYGDIQAHGLASSFLMRAWT